ncbi:ferritin-like domain-containing protein [Spirosoma utsteinense]|uniref:Ferritin-like metal-binding protein YciE n=1 Tax=Spirosoma utsteinense TaxID=2585773 RepID=A0ABR6WGG4_9BACT|nr:DUF892 family protein [Spirosoma utsteinense]MBC3789315.1 ferritin-like metal-binding protein YciE [Spirosoma utsteinense]MBC3795236.1 ferritin-like metal-binding protein YciE [Spirosoma utsteinense]
MENKQQFTQLIKEGLSAIKTGSEIAAKSSDIIINAATNPKLKEALQKNKETAKIWVERTDRAIQETGAIGQIDNPVVDGIGKVHQNILNSGLDDYSRDLGIINAGQLALHYWIAAFGTMANYAKQAGLDETYKAMKDCADESVVADEEHTKVAEQILGGN